MNSFINTEEMVSLTPSSPAEQGALCVCVAGAGGDNW